MKCANVVTEIMCKLCKNRLIYTCEEKAAPSTRQGSSTESAQ